MSVVSDKLPVFSGELLDENQLLVGDNKSAVTPHPVYGGRQGGGLESPSESANQLISQSASFQQIIKSLQNAGENMMASWAENLKISDFDLENLKIEVIKPVDFSIITQKEFVEKIRTLTGQTWSINYVFENEAKNQGVSSNQMKMLEVENRKKQAINSPAIQKILKDFEGAEVVAVVA